MTDEKLNNTLCKVVVTWQENTPNNGVVYKGVSFEKTVKEAVEDVINSRLPRGKVSLYTADEEALLIVVFPEHKRQFILDFPD